MNSLYNYLLIFAILLAVGFIMIEIRKSNHVNGTTFRERRRTRTVDKLAPLGDEILDGAMNLVDENKLKTREGMRFIVKVMQEIWKSDVERTNKVNEIVEQFETLRNKSLVVWIERYPKLSLFLCLILFAWITDEIRGPILRAIFFKAGIPLP